MGYLILTSIGTSTGACRDKISEIFPSLSNKNAVIITTASKDKENNKWNIITKEQLEELGYKKVEFVDLESTPNVNFKEIDTVYVCGGNTFKLQDCINKSNFKSEILDLLNRGGLYIGASAGALVLCPTIEIAGNVDPDENLINLQDLKGMGLVNFEILPHYSKEMDSQIESYKLKTSNEIKVISNEEIITIEI